MAAKGSGQQRKLGAIEPDAVGRGLANRVVDRMVPSGPADFDGWTAGDVSRWLTMQAESFAAARLAIGLGLWVLRDRLSEAAYRNEEKRVAALYVVGRAALRRWRARAQDHYGLPLPAGAAPRSLGQASSRASARTSESITSGQGRNLPTPEIAGSGAVPDQDPGGVTLAEVALRSPQEPSPPTEIRPSDSDVSNPSPPVADVLGTGSPPPERTTPGGPAMLDRIAVTPVEEIRGWGAVRVRDAVDRLAAADGRKLVTLAEWADLRAELRRLREAPTVPSKATRAGKATAVASGGRSGRKTPTTPPTSDPTGACTHPPARWNRLAYGVFCGVPGCGAKVR